MTETFGPTYADAYDLLYADKDYSAECDLIERYVREYAPGRRIRHVLDLGCGTGRHAVELARRGYRVVGVDRSPRMLELARARAEHSGARVQLHQGDVRTVRLDRQFDLVLLMFAVLGYQISDDDVQATLGTVLAHVRPGGLVVLDVWWGPAVETIGPSDRTRIIPLGDREIERRARGTLEGRNVCTVDYELVVRRDGVEESRARERHRMRYFDAEEIQRQLATAGLELRRVAAFPGGDDDPDTETWNAVVVAQRP